MAKFSSDIDILKYEPVLFGELHLRSQVLASGTGGTLSGTTFTASGASFVNAQVSAGGVVYLESSDGSLDGAYEIVSVDSATQLTVSVVRSDSDDSAVAPPGASNISYRISTFGPQAEEAGLQLTEHFGIGPGNPASDIDADDIVESSVLSRASAFAVISAVYAMLASTDEDEIFWAKSLHYKKLFEKALQRCQLSIDVDGDGVGDIMLVGGCIRLVRD